MKYLTYVFYFLIPLLFFFGGYFLSTEDEVPIVPRSQPVAVSGHTDGSVQLEEEGGEKKVKLSDVKQMEASVEAVQMKIQNDTAIAVESKQNESSEKRKKQSKQSMSQEEWDTKLQEVGERAIEHRETKELTEAELNIHEDIINIQEKISLTEEGEIPEEEREYIGEISLPEQPVATVRNIDEEKRNLIEGLRKSGLSEEEIKQIEETFSREAASEDAEQIKIEEESANLVEFLNSMPDADEIETLSEEERAHIGELIWAQKQ